MGLTEPTLHRMRPIADKVCCTEWMTSSVFATLRVAVPRFSSKFALSKEYSWARSGGLEDGIMWFMSICSVGSLWSRCRWVNTMRCSCDEDRE